MLYTMANYCSVFGCNNEAENKKLRKKHEKMLSFFRIPRIAVKKGKFES